VFNGTSTQKGQFVPTAVEGNWLRQLKMANEIQCIMPYATQKQSKTVRKLNIFSELVALIKIGTSHQTNTQIKMKIKQKRNMSYE